MNFSLYIFGTPNGYDQYPLDSNSAKFQEILTSCNSESQLSVLRDNQLVQYVYVRKISSDDGFCWGFGFVLVVTGVYCLNCHTLNDLFETAFYDVLLKGKLFRYQGNSFSYQVSKFVDDINEIKRINSFFKSKLEYELGDLFVTIPSSFSVGNGQTSISMKESASDINFAVKNFDVVHITNDEKSDSGQKPPTQPNPIPEPRVLWLLLSLVLLSGIVVATNVVIHQKKEKIRMVMEEDQIKKLKENHEEAIRGFDYYCNRIVRDEEGREGATNYVGGALKVLQTIEKCEKSDPLFSNSGLVPVFDDKFKLYRDKLVEVRNNLNEKYKPDLDKGESNPLCDAVRKRLELINSILEQTKGKSVLEVKISPDIQKDAD
jgi:hypothetical protein